MLISKIMAEKIENCFKNSHLSLLHKQAELGLPAENLELTFGQAFYLGSDSFFTQVMGWGFEEDANKLSDDLLQIQNFYQQHQLASVDIELSPLAGISVVNLLQENQFKVSEFTNVSTLLLANYDENEPSKANIIIPEKENLNAWSSAVAIGFNQPSAAQQFNLYGQCDSIIPFQANVGEQIAAGATLAIHGALCDLGMTSTLPGFRGMGLQKILLHERLKYAKQQGVKVAVVATEPGSISDLNIQKVGFKCAYTRMKFTKPCA